MSYTELPGEVIFILWIILGLLTLTIIGIIRGWIRKRRNLNQGCKKK